MKAQLFLTELLHMLWPQEDQTDVGAGQDEPEQWLRSTLQYMRENYMHEIKLEKLAELADMHPSYYSFPSSTLICCESNFDLI